MGLSAVCECGIPNSYPLTIYEGMDIDLKKKSRKLT